MHLANALPERVGRFSMIENAASPCPERFQNRLKFGRVQQYDGARIVICFPKLLQYSKAPRGIFVHKCAQNEDVNFVSDRRCPGLSAVEFRLARTTHVAVMEVAGDGFRIKADLFRRVLTSAPTLKMLANRFAAVQAMQIAQTAACNRLYEVGARMARWLLMPDDRVAPDCLNVTHDFLSMMLGTDRPSVTAAARNLQHQAIIQYKRGTLRILDRKKLEDLVCECYAAIRQFNRDLGLPEQPR